MGGGCRGRASWTCRGSSTRSSRRATTASGAWRSSRRSTASGPSRRPFPTPTAAPSSFCDDDVGVERMPELAGPTTRGRSAADHLAVEIAAMQEGDRLGTKKELCARLGVASGTLNEAIRLLQERGLVTLRPGPKGGIFVARTDPIVRLGRTLLPLRAEPDLVAGAIEVQGSLQALAAVDALRHRTPDDVTALL